MTTKALEQVARIGQKVTEIIIIVALISIAGLAAIGFFDEDKS